MHLHSGYENRRARVEMLPLIDIVFLLLVFFIYAMLSMVVHRGVRVRLPEAAGARAAQRDHIDVTITEGNVILVGAQAVGRERLAAEVKARLAGRSGVPVFINGDAGADLGAGIGVLDELQRAGVEEVSFRCSQPGD